MYRRAYISATATAATVALAGCSLGGSGGDPESVAASYISAVEEGDLETADEHAHPDGPLAAQLAEVNSEEFREEREQVSLEIEESILVNKTNGFASVDVIATVDGRTSTARVYLRTNGGDWKVYNVGPPEAPRQNRAPLVNFGFEFEYVDNAGVMTITHDGGDTVDAAEMIVRGDGIVDVSRSDPSPPDLVTVDRIRFDAEQVDGWNQGSGPLLENHTGKIQSGQSITVGVATDYAAEVVWDSRNSEDSTVLAVDYGPMV